MGRHADRHEAAPTPLSARIRTWVERVLVALAAGAVLALVLMWMGQSRTVGLWAGGGAAVAVLGAAWVSSTVPTRAPSDQP